MRKRFIDAAFSIGGLSIFIGVVGFASSLVTLFLNINNVVSIKWLIFVTVCAACLIAILLKIIHDQTDEIVPPAIFESPIGYVETEGVFVIRRNENFINSIIVGCYAKTGEIDRLAYLGVVHLVQDKVIQIKIRYDTKVYDKIPATSKELKQLIIKPVIPVTAFEFLNIGDGL